MVSITKSSTYVDTLVWAQMIEHIAGKDIRYVVNRTPFFGAIVSRARVPIVRSIYVDLPSDVAKSHPAHRNDRDPGSG